MAAERRRHISRPAQYILAENRNMSQSSSLIVLPYRHTTVMPCLTTMEECSPNRQRTPSCHNSEIYRCHSGVLNSDRRTYMQHSSLSGFRRTSPSANIHNASSAPRGLVTYLQLCRPIFPKVRANSSGLRSHNQYIHKFSVDDTLKHINLNPGLAVYGVPLGQVQSCSQNVPPGVEKVQIHVYLPYAERQSAEEVSSKFSSLSLQECKNPEDDKVATMQNLA
ncbi:uncharacterized protein ACNLHF_009235 [Anomaloglossus baeobatrachus]